MARAIKPTEKQPQLFNQSYKIYVNHATSYLWPRGCTHIHKHAHTFADKSDYKKPGVRRPVAGTRLVIKINLYIYHYEQYINNYMDTCTE